MWLRSGDSGYIANLQISTEPISLGLSSCYDDELRFLAFYDIGEATLHTPQPGDDPHIPMAGVGMGFRYTLGSTVQLRTDYGWPLKEATPGDGYRSRWHVGIILSR